MRLVILCSISLLTIFAKGNCDFSTGDFLEELNRPASILKIEVKVPKSAKFNRNFAKILQTRSQSIPSDLKKSFLANVFVSYEFGTCQYIAKVKQHGDLRDHVSLIDGKPFRSIKVKLKDGNILNAVQFSLLIPETRNNLHEILGSVFIRELGFLAPETFHVRTVINNVEAIMLFQEGMQKELLERHGRREGPLFEGDESLLWNYQDYENLKLKNLSLALVSNPKWFLRGGSSQEITLSAYSQLQKASLLLTQKLPENPYTIFPNESSKITFMDYFFSMLVMNGTHALYANNRRYYFNSFTQMFEPIYYDGDLTLDKKNIIDASLVAESFIQDYVYSYTEKISTKSFELNIYKAFESRVLIDEVDLNIFFNNSIATIKENIKVTQDQINLIASFSKKNNLLDAYKGYVENEKIFNVLQKKISSVQLTSPDKFIASSDQGDNMLITASELAGILSKNEHLQNRTIFLSLDNYLGSSPPFSFESIEVLGGHVYRSQGANYELDELKKTLIITQKNPDDWLLLNNVNLTGWTLDFIGLIPDPSIKTVQRFNSHGMTGCLNLFNAVLKDTMLVVQNGQCEDSLNVVNSTGSIKHVNITNAFADAVDLDYSKLTLDSIDIAGAGNDCLDVSGGTYEVNTAKLIRCGDKGISVGEKSSLVAKNIELMQAQIGAASKDFSYLYIKQAEFIDTPVCVEAMQKKQEFGGATAHLAKINCSGQYLQDKDSSIILGLK